MSNQHPLPLISSENVFTEYKPSELDTRSYKRILFFALIMGIYLHASAENVRNFDLPMGDAKETLFLFASQAGVSVVYDPGVVGGNQTNLVQGSLVPSVALKQMLEGTVLSFETDNQSQAYAVVLSSKNATVNNYELKDPNTMDNPTLMPESKKRKGFSLLAGVLSSFVAVNPALGQEPEIEELSPFEITADEDDGWTAGTTLTATRTRQSIRDLPISIDAVTEEFLDDIGAYDLGEAGNWIAGLDSERGTDFNLDSNRTSFRGMELGDRDNPQSSRNLFSWFPRTDSYNVERIDFNKGSNSLMFGESSPGGLAAVYTKRARAQNFGKVFAMVDGWGGHRVTFDLNRKVTDNFFVRLNVVDRNRSSYQDGTEDKLTAYSIAATFRPFEKTIIRAEYEDMDFERNRPGRVEVNQRAARARGFSSSSRQYYTSDGEYYDASSRMFYPSDGQGGFLDPFQIDNDDRRNGPTGDDLSLAKDLVQQVRNRDTDEPEFTIGPIPIEVSPNDRNTNRPVENFSLWIEQGIGDLTMELAFNRQQQEQTWIGNSYRPLSFEGSGRIFYEEDYSSSQFGNEVNNARFTVAYPVRTKWFNQYLVGNISYMDDLASSFRQRLVNRAKAFDPATGEYDFTEDLNERHRIRYRTYFDSNDLVAELQDSTWIENGRAANLPTIPGIFEPIWVERTTANRPFIDKRYTRTASFTSSGNLFTNRLTTLLGIRYDAFNLKRYILPEGSPEELIAEYGELAYWGQDVFVGYPDEAPEQYRYLPEFDVSDTTYSAGLSYQVTNNFNVYGNFSTSFRWQGRQNFLGELLGPQEGETVEVGFKADLLENRVSLTAAVFQVDRQNVGFNFDSGNNADELELLFNDGMIDIDTDGTMTFIPAMQGDPGFVEIARGFNSEHRTITASETSRGFEMSLSSTRVGGFRARLALAYIDIESERDLSQYIPLVELAEQRAAERAPIIEANWPNDPLYDPDELPEFEEDLREYLEDAQDVIEFNSGTGLISGSRARPWRFSYAIDYEVPDDTPLEGLRILLSGKWSDDYLQDINDGVLWYGGSTNPLDLSFFYETTIWEQNTQFSLRFRDIVDFSNPDGRRPNGGFVDQFTDEETVKYRNIPPPNWELGISVKF